MAGADASNLVFDGGTRVNAFVLAGTLGPGGAVSPDGEVNLDGLRAVLAPRIAAVRRLNQRPDTSRRPWSWTASAAELEVHIRLAAAPDGLEALCGQLMVTPLDPLRPLWEVLVVPRVAEGRAGLVIRLHHALGDGAAALGIIGALADPDSVSVPSPGPDLPPPDRGLRAVVAAVDQWIRLAAGPRLRPTALLGRVGRSRGIRFLRTDLARVEQAADDAGGTVNDLVLAVIAGAVETTLRAQGEEPPRALPVSVPVAVPRRRGSGNALGSMIVPLPLGIPFDARIAAIHALVAAELAAARRRGDAGVARSPLAMRVVARYAQRQRRLAIVTSNVRGPAAPLRFGGAPLLDVAPIGTLGGNVRVSVVVASYAGALSWGIHTDEAAVPAGILADAVRCELAALGI